MNTTKIYVFDIEGNLVNEFNGITETAAALNIDRGTTQTAIKRKSFCKSRYYFSRNKGFTIPFKKASFNPLFSRNKMFFIPAA